MIRGCFTSAFSLVCLVFECLTNVYLFFDHQHERKHTVSHQQYDMDVRE